MAAPRISLFTAVIAGFALWQWQARRYEREQQRQLARSKPKPHEESTWEGEGGALKYTGAHMGPDPALPGH
ncbi:hypothetical protein [Pelomonas sp. KK5]|uniref:hypothetical protein n=1 Tax=Pelomonas sp. KK5 TaxID=1855730 RepID=UPI00097C66BF|nr:hypothetical protein [Pelomonas sp. KK5]